MPQLAIVTDAWKPQVNGVVTTIEKLAELAPPDWHVKVIHPGLFKTITVPRYREYGIAVNPWMIAPHLAGCDALHIATEGALGLAARLYAQSKRLRHTSAFHTNFPSYLQARTKLPERSFVPFFRWFHKRSATVLAPTLSTVEQLIAWKFKNVALWDHGYDETLFRPDLPQGPFSEKLRVLYVGRVAIEKNLRPLLTLSKNPAYDISIIGDGPERRRLELAYGEANFLGTRHGRELALYYANADVFAFPSRTDTLGIVMLEAMACGTPVAAYPVQGPQDIVIEGLGGCLDESLENAINRARKLPREHVPQNARLHSWEKCARIFYEAVGRGRKAGQ